MTKNLPIIIQFLISLISGIIFGMLAHSIELSLFTLIIMEVVIFAETQFLSTNETYIFELRFVLTCTYLLGWILGRWLYYDELGFEKYYDDKDEEYISFGIF